jgi:membrane protein YqaA with SNARE-associated domain
MESMMIGLEELSIAWLAVWCFGLTVVSAVFPWVNAEVMVLSLPVLAQSPYELTALVLVATAGQMTGKVAVYWTGRGAGKIPKKRTAEAMERWRQRFERRPGSASGFVFLSSAVGIPPFYVMSLVAGALKLGFGRYLLYGTCGRLVRFGLIAFAPQLILGMWS